MEAMTTNMEQAATTRQHAVTEAKFIPFTTKEVLRCIPTLAPSTVKWWIKRKLITPKVKGRLGGGGDALWSAWQAICIVVMGSALKSKRGEGTYLGGVGVKNAWTQLSSLSDELLLAENEMDMHLAEQVAAALQGVALEGQVPPDIYEGIAKVVRLIDRKNQWMRVTNRIR
jgi:hypothetical protein